MTGNDTKFPTDHGEIELRAQESFAQIDRLLKFPAPAVVRLGAFFAAAVPYGKPKFDVLPSSIREAAKDLGFRPVCYMWWGRWPLPLMVNTPQFVGPEGFTKLESYKGTRFYIRTLFTDGSCITTSNRAEGGKNLITKYVASVGDFEQDYLRHLEEVRNYMKSSGERPIYIPDRHTVSATYGVYNRLHVPAFAAAVLMLSELFIIACLIYGIYEIAC